MSKSHNNRNLKIPKCPFFKFMQLFCSMSTLRHKLIFIPFGHIQPGGGVRSDTPLFYELEQKITSLRGPPNGKKLLKIEK